jgi:hypothetical protein
MTTNNYVSTNSDSKVVQELRAGSTEANKAILDTTHECVEKIEKASSDYLAQKEKQSQVKCDTFSDEKGKEQNRQYQEYLEGSIKENFKTKCELVDESLALKEEICNKKIELAQMKANVEIELNKKRAEVDFELEKKKLDVENEIKKKQSEAELKYEETLEKIKGLELNKVKLWVWRVLWPMLGVGMSIITYLLLNLK